MRRKYLNPPVVEALCEFQFIPRQPFDLTIPGLFYEKIREEFPQKEEQPGVSFQLQMTERGVEQKIAPAPPKLLFFKPDRTALVQLAPDLLAVNCLKPYPSWQNFKPLILNNLEIYRDIANPKALRRISLRYINVFEFDSPEVELTDYFYYHPNVPPNLPQEFQAFLSRVEIPYADGTEQLTLTLGTIIPKKPRSTSLTLDIDYAIITPEFISFENVPEWLEKAHQEVETAFEASITDKARALFGEVK